MFSGRQQQQQQWGQWSSEHNGSNYSSNRQAKKVIIK